MLWCKTAAKIVIKRISERINQIYFPYLCENKKNKTYNMKKIVKILIVAAATFFAAEVTADAQLLKNLVNKVTSSTTEKQPDATSQGEAAGTALKDLYKTYNSKGKIDVTNLTTLKNLTTLVNSIKELKGNTSKSAFYKDFVKGLMKGSGDLVNQSNSTSVMTSLTNIVNKYTSSSSSNTSKLDNAIEIASSVSEIMKMFK